MKKPEVSSGFTFKLSPVGCFDMSKFKVVCVNMGGSRGGGGGGARRGSGPPPGILAKMCLSDS